jgi:S1-C subfamily serine protease
MGQHRSYAWLVGVLCGAAVWAQAPGVPIEGAPVARDGKTLAGAEALRAAGKLLNREAVNALLAKPQPARVALPPAGTQPLGAREVCGRARAALVRVGWYFKCQRCDKWHLNLSGGYALTADGVVGTCHHVLAAEKIEMREGYLVAATVDGTAWPVRTVLACDAGMDAAIVAVDGLRCEPLALNDQVAPGDPAYLFSDPLGVSGYFSAGLVNRFYWRQGQAGDATTLAGAKALRVHVSTDWAPGSSGAAVLDACGNVIGHVSTIAVLSGGDAKPATDPKQPATPPQPRPGQIVLHEAVPARCLMLLAGTLR